MMKLTESVKASIDAMDYQSLLTQWRFAPSGDALFQGESGQYFQERMTVLRRQPGGQKQHGDASKSIGW